MAAIHTKHLDDPSVAVSVAEMSMGPSVDMIGAVVGDFHKQVFNAPYVAITQPHYRRAADSFAEDANGIVYLFNGIDQPLTFDPAVGSYERSGVDAPVTAPSISGSGTGNIVGDFYAYVRFVDRNGNFSSFSPISTQYTAQSSTYSITGATYATPIVITSSIASSISIGQIIKISGVLGNTAANGIFAAQPLTSSTLALYTDQSLSVPVSGNGVYISSGTARTGVSSIRYGNVPVPTQSKVTRRQILRNQDGNLEVFYIDIDTDDLTSGTFTSQTDSDSLLNFVALADTNGNSLVDKTIPPNFKKVVAFHLGRLFATGNEPYSEGAVSVTNGSNVVTGIGTEWGQITFGGRYFEVVGGTKKYLIDRCASPTSLILADPYEGTTEPYAYYSIHVPDGERKSIYWSEAGESEAWPLANTLNLAEDPNAGEITGLLSQHSWIYILAENRTYRFSFVSDPLNDGFIVKSTQRGCINQRCWVQVEDIAYMLDYLGIHAFAGNDDQDIGTPAIQDLFRIKPTGKYKINWNAKRNFHAVYSPGEGLIRWFVSLTGNYTPQHAICYHVRLKRWWIEEFPWPVSSSVTGRLKNKPQVYLGTNAKRIMALGESTLDGPLAAEGTVRGQVTSSGVTWIADSSAVFASSGLVGNSVTIVRGKGKGQRRTIASVSGTTINVIEPWLDRPDTTSVYQLGGISWNWKSGWAKWIESDDLMARAVSVQYKPTENDSEMFIRLYRDLSESAQEWERVVSLDEQNGIGLLENDPVTDLTIDATRSKGYVFQRLDGFTHWFVDGYRFVSVEMHGTQNAEQHTIYRLSIDGASGPKE